jgi:hypothetical protein
MRGYIDNQSPTYRELLDGAPPARIDASDELVGAHPKADRRSTMLMMALGAFLVIAMSLGAVWMLGVD